ncbi:hypothetical protein TorRG33x02_321270, partial [Trema orientale]
MTKLRSMKGYLKKWKVETFGDMRAEKRMLKGRLEAIDKQEASMVWSESLKTERNVIKSRLQELIIKVEGSLKIKSKFSLAKEVDANSKLLYKLMNVRMSKNYISKLERDDRVLLESEEDITTKV